MQFQVSAISKPVSLVAATSEAVSEKWVPGLGVADYPCDATERVDLVDSTALERSAEHQKTTV